MRESDVAAIMRGVTPVLREQFAALSARVVREAEQAEALRQAEHRAFMAEQREGLAAMKRSVDERLATVRDGVDGKDGADGAPGRDGVDGNDGAPGRDGADGAPGADGEAGTPGIDGVNGKDGADGRDGEDGKDGADGQNGADGAAGADGKDGADGQPGERGEKGEDGEKGAEGLSLTDVDVTRVSDDMCVLSFEIDGIRNEFEIRLPRGPDGANGADAYAGMARGLFDPDAEYRAMDTVSLNGSEWRARRDAPGPLPGDGWMLSAGRGKRGEKGDRGERGMAGMDGAAGATPPAPVALYVDTDSMEVVLTRDDGIELRADMRPLAEKIRDAARG